MIMKVKYDEDDKPTEFIQITSIGIDEDGLYGITDEDENPFFEIVVENHEITRHTELEDGTESLSDRTFLSIEILTDNMFIIKQWE